MMNPDVPNNKDVVFYNEYGEQITAEETKSESMFISGFNLTDWGWIFHVDYPKGRIGSYLKVDVAMNVMHSHLYNCATA